MTAAAAQAQSEGRTYPAPREVYRVMAGLSLALALASLDGNIVGPALPRIVSDLGGLSHIAWVVTAFAVSATATTLLYGKLSDQYGRRPAFAVSIGLFLLGSVLCGASRSMGMLIGSRALQGMGAGGLIILAQTTIGDIVPPRERGRYQGIIAATFALCSVAGPLLGGAITDLFSWPWIFYINLPLGAAALAILMVTLPRHVPRAPARIDVLGFALIVAATCSGLLVLSWGGVVYPWTSPQILLLTALTAVLAASLVPVETRAAAPAIPPHLFREPAFTIGSAGISLAVLAFFGSVVFVPLFFQMASGLSATEAGLRLSPVMGGLIVSSVLSGRLVARTGRYRRFPVAGLLVAVLSYAGLAWAALAVAPANVFDVLLAALGAGLGLVMPIITMAVQNAVDPSDLGIATATLGFLRSLGSAFGVAMSGLILQMTLHRTVTPAGGPSLATLGLTQARALPEAQRVAVAGTYGHALAVTFAAAAAVSALACAILLFLPEKPLRGRG